MVSMIFAQQSNTFQNNPLSQSDTMYANMRWYLISNNRQLLSQLYFEHGIVQTFIDQPVDDAYRSGFELSTDQLSADELEDLYVGLEEFQVTATHGQGEKWGRLFGGGGVLVITEQDPETPLNIDGITQDTELKFRAVDMWELFQDKVYIQGDMRLDDGSDYYSYYGKRVHRSRIIRIDGKEAPSFIRPRLRGWGMSEVEKLVRSINSYLKNQDVVFELLDEAKIDVYKIKGFKSSLAQKSGTKALSDRVQMANILKNYLSALTMDAEDDYQQKQIQFTGLSDMLLQIRQGIAADLKMPMTKIFGISAAGFNSGEDDLENYNSMVEADIRSKNKFRLLQLIKIYCRHKYGFAPDDLRLSYKPLRVLSAEQEENVKEKKFNRIVGMYDRGLMEVREVKQAVNKDALLPIKIQENDDVLDLGHDEGEDEGNGGGNDNRE